MRRGIISVAVVLGMLAAACSSGTSSSSTPTTTPGSNVTSTGTTDTLTGVAGVGGRFDPSSIRFVAALERFDACDAVLDHFRTEALARVGPYGLGGDGFFIPWMEGDMAFSQESGADGAATTAAASAGAVPPGGDFREGVDYSGSNVQVVGVDEPDIVKTDGSRIVTVMNGRLSITDADEGRLLGTYFLGDGWNHRFFLSGDRVIVFSDGGGVVPMPVEREAATSVVPPFEYGERVTIQEIDISDPLAIDVVRTLSVEGRFLSARSIDGTARVVLTSYPSQLPFVYPSGPAAEDFAEEANRRIVAESTLDVWLPDFVLADGDGNVIDSGLAVECERMHRPAEFAGFDTMSVLTIDLDGGLDAGTGTGLIAQGETVYASTESLYVATTVWVPEEFAGTRDSDFEEKYETALHKFSISGTEPAVYEASGGVSGHLLSQFSLDEHGDHLRVAVTDGPPWWFSDTSESFVKVLRQEGDRLVEVGSVGNMGKGERIFSVRFVGDTAYVVTFRQTDPFYVVNLADPENPIVAGELKIPGYSAYLHPLGDGRVLGVGQDATADGRVTGAKVSLFDVSDPANPVEQDVWTLGSGNTQVEWDHLAFLWWPPEGVAVLPVSDWQSDFYGAVVLEVDGTLAERGRVSHDDRIAVLPESDCTIVPAEQLREWVDGEGIIVQVCGDRDAGGYGSHSCEVLPSGDDNYVEEFLASPVSLSDTDRIEICWPEYRGGEPVIRSLVIGDTLWTLTWRTLQSNDLGTLDSIDQVNIG